MCVCGVRVCVCVCACVCVCVCVMVREIVGGYSRWQNHDNSQVKNKVWKKDEIHIHFLTLGSLVIIIRDFTLTNQREHKATFFLFSFFFFFCFFFNPKGLFGEKPKRKSSVWPN